MANLSKPLDYTDKDFDSVRNRLFNLISGAFPEWTDREVANFGNLLIEAWAFIGDVLFKYQDNQANESRWSRATLRKNMLALSKLIDFQPATATASQVDVTISLKNPPASGAVTIPAGTIVRTRQVSEPVEFRLLLDAEIPTGDSEVTGVTAENAEPQTEVFGSTGKPNQEIVLSSTPYLDDSASISDGNGAFTEVDNFLDSTSTDRHYTVTVDENDKATIRFGNGTNGVVPSGTITVDYKTGGGSSGQVEAGTVQAIEGTFTDEFGTAVQLEVNNPDASTPAVDRESIEKIRQTAPLSIQTLNRTVSRKDYENNALKLNEVARALMLTSNEDSSVQENEGFLFVIPEGGGNPTTALKDSVKTQVTETFPNTLTFNVIVSDPDYKTVDVEARVYLRKGANATQTKSRIESNLKSFFAIRNDDGRINEEIDFGFYFTETSGDPEGKLPWTDIHNVIRDTEGVSKLEAGSNGLLLNGSSEDITLLLREFPILGTITLKDASTGGDL